MITETAYFAHEIQALRDAFADDAFEEFTNDRLRTIVRRLLTTVEAQNDRIDDLRINLKGLEAFRRVVWREALKVDRSVDEMALALFLDGLEPKARRSVVAEAVAKGTTIWGVLPEPLRRNLRKQARDLMRTLRNSAEEATPDV